jgi:hypothetical protein
MHKILLICDTTACSAANVELGDIHDEASVTVIAPDEAAVQPAHSSYDQIIIDMNLSDAQIQSVISAMRSAGVSIPIIIYPTGKKCWTAVPSTQGRPENAAGDCSRHKREHSGCGAMVISGEASIAGAACIYPHFFDDIDSGIIISTREGVCVYSNNTIQMLIGGSIVQRHIKELFGDYFPEEYKSGDGIQFDTVLRHAGIGRDIPVHVEAVPIAEKCPLGWYILVTGLENFSEFFETVEESAHQLMPPEFPETLMDRLAHEVRTPAALIKESIELIAEQYLGDINAMQKQYLDVAQKNIGRLVTAVNLMLEHTSANSVIAKLDVQDCNIHDILHSIVVTLNQLYPYLAGSIHLHHSAEVVVKTDQAKLAYILYTLMDMLVSGQAGAESVDVSVRSLDAHALIIIHTRYCGGDVLHADSNYPDALEICKVLLWLLKGSLTVDSEPNRPDGCLKIILPLEYETQIWRNET